MALVNRDLVISWGAYTISTANNRLINGWTYNEDSYETASVQFEYVVTGNSDAAFAAECSAAEAAFRTPRQALSITQGGVPLLALSHTGNSGFDSISTIVKTGQVGDTGRSRFYQIHIVFGRPADNVGTSGRRTGSIDVSYTPSRQRIVTISGTYTVLTTTARAQYLSAIDTYCASVITGLGITQYELLEEPTTDENDTGKVIDFNRVYREIIYPQAGSPNDPAIVGDSLSIEVTRDGTEDGSGEEGLPYHLANLNVTFDCSIDKNVTTDLEGKYKSIKSSVLDKIRSGMGVSTIGIIDESPSYDYTANRISVRMTVAGVVAGSLIHYHKSTKQTWESGKVFVPAWTGDPLSYYKFQGPTKILRISVTYKRSLGGGQPGIGGGSGGGQSAGGGDGNVFGGGTSWVGGGGVFGRGMGGDLFGGGTSWVAGGGVGITYGQDAGGGLFGQTQLPTSLGNVVGAEGGDAGANAAGGAGGGAGTVQTLDSQAGGGSRAANVPVIAEPTWEEIYKEYEAIPLFVGLPDGDKINFLDTIETLIEQSIKQITSSGGRNTVATPDIHPELNRR
jgi:hypothetical protein